MMHTTTRRPRLIPWLAAVTFLLSLVSPMLTLAAPPPEDPPPSATQCPDGMTWNEETEECEPPPDIPTVDQDEPLDCPEGQVDQQGACVPDPNQQPPGCEAGQTLDEQGNCVPDTEQFPTCEQGTVLNPQTNQCEPVEQTAPPPATKQSDESETSAPPTAVNFIAILVHDCAGHVSDPNLTESEYEHACLGSHSEVEFVAEYGGGSWTNSSNSRGQVGWYNVPAGPWSVQETIPPRYSDPVVFCGSESGGDHVPVDASGGRISGTFAATGETIVCDWYSLRPPQPTHDQQLTIFKRTCPLGTDRTLDIESLLVACQITPDVEFFASQGSPQLEQRTNGRNGGVTWRSMFSGPWWVEETPLPSTGAPKVICGYRDESTGAPTWTEVPVTGTRLEGTFEPGADPYDCYWFNFRTEPATASNQVVIFPFRCPEGTDTELSFTELIGSAPCPVETEAGFTLIPEAAGYVVDRSLNPYGEVLWTNIPPVHWEVQQTIVPGFGATRVYCSLNGDRPFDLVPSAGASIDGLFESTDERLLCYWYNFAGIAAEVVPPLVSADTAIPPPMVIEAVKRTCPSGTDESLPLADLTAACPVTPGVDFVLEFGGSTSHQVTDASGTVRWTDVPQVDWALYEGIPPGFGEPFAYCGPIGEASPSVFETVRGSWTGFPTSAGVHCDWFNFPTDETQLNTIAMYPYACPEGTDPSLDITVLRMECAPIPDVEFTATISGRSESHRTGSEGWAFWHDVPTGPWSMRETVPDGYSDPLVVCSPLGYPYDHPTLTTTGSVFEENFLGTGAEMRCALFHFTGGSDTSTEPGDDGHIIEIDKYDCPVGVDASAGREYLLEMCLPFPDIEFTVTADGTSTTFTTDAAGHVTFPGIPDGPYTIQETMPGGYDDPAVFCGSGAVPAPGGLLEGAFDTPGDLHCQWFNVWPGGEESITLLKYVCPATVDPTADIATITAACTEPGDGYSFTLHTSRGNSLLITNSSGRLDWGRDNVRGGPFTLTELVPDDARGAPVWQCGANGERTTVDAPDGELSASFREGHYACWVYNFPAADDDGDGNTVTVNKWRCPVGFEFAGVPVEDLLAACPDSMDYVDFTLTDADGSVLQTTVGGIATWTNVAPGDVTITETVPLGIDPHTFASCSTDDGIPVLSEVSEGLLTLPPITAAGTEIECDWYNVPYPGPSLLIRKFECPAGVDIAETPDAYRDTCTTPMDGVGFTLTDGAASDFPLSTVGGEVEWHSFAPGAVTVTEDIPPGYDPNPFVVCPTAPGGLEQVDATSGVLHREIGPGALHDCNWYNLPLEGGGDDDEGHIVEVYKHNCPAGTDPESVLTAFGATCGEPGTGIEFTLVHSAGSSTGTVDEDGDLIWYRIPDGPITITESVPPGYGEPVWFCGSPREQVLVDAPGGVMSAELEPGDTGIRCKVFNIEKGPAEVTVHKWTCPAGYDVDAPGADPTVDCTEATDGVTFTLEHPGGVIGTATTGDVMPGAVSFTGLDPDVYAITETLPEGIDNVFVWDCTGTDIGSVHPTPLSRGIRLSVEVAGGDAIACDWYNVPDPVSGTVTVIKQECSTPTFVDAVDCDTYEHGAEFELFEVDGDISHGAGTTDASGGFSWTGLPEGRYRLDELDGEPCHVTVSRDDGAGVPWVEAGEPTVFTVYNCAADTTTTSTGKIPTDYPNTGAGPIDSAVSPLLQDGTGAATPEAAASPEAFYEIACLDAPAEDACPRGAVPTHLTIDPIGVDAEIEVVEIVDGVMQPPSDPYLAAWYKETARLGEANNTVIAGHLNWWNVPEGVFYRLDALEAGDRIAVTGDDGLTYLYEVQWVRLEPNDAPPALDVVGPTQEPSLTLITCGGEWDAATAEYDHRTVVRAELIDVVPGDPAATTQSGRTS